MANFMECSIDKCSWFGPEELLHTHYEKCHAQFIMKESILPILNGTDKVVNASYLLQSHEKFFIVKVKQEQKNSSSYYNSYNYKCFTISCMYVGGVEEAQKWMYRVHMDTHNFSSKCVVSNMLGNPQTTKFVAKVTGRSSYNSNVELYYNDKKIDSCKVVIIPKIAELDNIKNLDIEKALACSLHCPKCSQFMEGPIYICDKGHSVCLQCKNAGICCSCGTNITSTRNLFAEEFAAKICDIKSECAYKNRGCGLVLPLNEVASHERGCLFGNVPCPLKDVYTNCLWTGSLKKMVRHVHDTHLHSYMCECRISHTLTEKYLNESHYDAWIFKYDNETFKLCYSLKDRAFRWTVELIGLNCHLYEFRLTLMSRNKDRFKFTMTYPCLPYGAETDVRSWCTCSDKLVSNFLDENRTLTFQVNVIKKE